MVFALAAWAAGNCLKLPSEAARRTGVNGLINSYYAHTTHLQSPTVLTTNLKVLLLSVANDTFPFFFFFRSEIPTGEDS